MELEGSQSNSVNTGDRANRVLTIPAEFQRKMLQTPSFLTSYKEATSHGVPPMDAMNSALTKNFAGQRTKDFFNDEPYKHMCTPENLETVKALASGGAKASGPGAKVVHVPSYAKLKGIVPKMDIDGVTELLLLEQRGVNADSAARPHVIKYLLDQVNKNHARKGPKAQASEEEAKALTSGKAGGDEDLEADEAAEIAELVATGMSSEEATALVKDK